MTNTDLQSAQKYELMIMLLPDLGEDGTARELEEVRKIIAEGHGKIEQEDLWGVQELSYRIKKHDEAYYAVINFNITTDKIQELEKSLNIHHSVIRFLLLKTPEKYTYKTFKEYKEESALADKEDEAKKKKEDKNKNRPKPKVEVKKPFKKEIKEEPKEKPRKEAKVEVKVEPKKDKLEDVDDKLKSIIDDPDISL